MSKIPQKKPNKVVRGEWEIQFQPDTRKMNEINEYYTQNCDLNPDGKVWLTHFHITSCIRDCFQNEINENFELLRPLIPFTLQLDSFVFSGVKEQLVNARLTPVPESLNAIQEFERQHNKSPFFGGVALIAVGKFKWIKVNRPSNEEIQREINLLNKRYAQREKFTIDFKFLRAHKKGKPDSFIHSPERDDDLRYLFDEENYEKRVEEFTQQLKEEVAQFTVRHGEMKQSGDENDLSLKMQSTSLESQSQNENKANEDQTTSLPLALPSTSSSSLGNVQPPPPSDDPDGEWT